MVIDDHKNHILTNYQSVKKLGKATDTDHFTEYMDINLEFISEKPERVELFNFKDKDSQVVFKKITTETDEFTKCFSDST